MPQLTQKNTIRILPKGLITIPKKLRDKLGFEENGLAWINAKKGKLIIEPVRTLPYRVRSYADKELKEFFKLDDKETKQLRKKRLI